MVNSIVLQFSIATIEGYVKYQIKEGYQEQYI